MKVGATARPRQLNRYAVRCICEWNDLNREIHNEVERVSLRSFASLPADYWTCHRCTWTASQAGSGRVSTSEPSLKADDAAEDDPDLRAADCLLRSGARQNTGTPRQSRVGFSHVGAELAGAGAEL